MKKRGTAYGVLAAVLVLGTLFGTFRSLTSERRSASEAFYVGVDGSGYGISTNLDLRVEYARNLCKIAARYDASAETEQVEQACSDLEAAEGFSEKYDANTALTDAVDTLDQKLQSLSLSQEDDEFRQSLTADIASYEMKIDKLATDFNAGARQFNDHVLGGFPAELFGALTGVEEVEEYA